MIEHDISCVCDDCILDANMMCTCEVVENGETKMAYNLDDIVELEKRFEVKKTAYEHEYSRSKSGEFCKECGGCYPQR